MVFAKFGHMYFRLVFFIVYCGFINCISLSIKPLICVISPCSSKSYYIDDNEGYYFTIGRVILRIQNAHHHK